MKPKLKYSLIYFVFILVIIVTSFLDKYESFRIIKYILFITLLSIFAFNLFVRRKYSFKSYFLNKRNIFTSKLNKSIYTEIPTETILEKIKEVLGLNDLKIEYIDPTSSHIMAISTVTWKSWGENIYIDITETNEVSEIKFNSVAIFQVTSWGKNETNFNKFLAGFEESLII